MIHKKFETLQTVFVKSDHGTMFLQSTAKNVIMYCDSDNENNNYVWTLSIMDSPALKTQVHQFSTYSEAEHWLKKNGYV